MGPDGGEAVVESPRRTNTSVASLPRALPFVTLFWGQNDAGFEAISARMKASQRTLDELKTLYKERADIEAEYSKRLAKLSKQALGHSETGALKAAFDVVKIELDTTSRTHGDLASMIKKDLEGAVTDFANKSWNSRKAAQANIEKLHKNKQTQEAYVNNRAKSTNRTASRSTDTPHRAAWFRQRSRQGCLQARQGPSYRQSER